MRQGVIKTNIHILHYICKLQEKFVVWLNLTKQCLVLLPRNLRFDNYYLVKEEYQMLKASGKSHIKLFLICKHPARRYWCC